MSTSSELQREPQAELTPVMLRRAQLSIVRRGYKPEEVDALLQDLRPRLTPARFELRVARGRKAAILLRRTG